MKSNSPDKNERIETWLGLALLLLLLIGCFFVMRPFLTAVMWAGILGFSLWPVHTRILAWLKGRRTLAALATTMCITVVLVVPFVILGFSLAEDVRELGTATRKWVESEAKAPPAWLSKLPVVGPKAGEYWQEAAEDLSRLMEQMKQKTPVLPGAATNEVEAVIAPDVTELAASGEPSSALRPAGDKLIEIGGTLLGKFQSTLIKGGLAIGRGLVEVGLSVFLVFFIFRDGVRVVGWLQNSIRRIAGDRGRQLLEAAGSTVRGVVYGILGTALVQGVMAGIGFLIAGVPGAALLGLLTFFLSIVPMGPPLVWVPATLWLFNHGHTGWAIFMLIWGLGVSTVDNFVKPWLISQGSDMPFVLIFFGVIGGALAFGFIGVFLGPTLLSVGYRLIGEWTLLEREGGAATPAK